MDFFQILVVPTPGPYAEIFFFIFGKKKDFLRIFFVLVNMGPYGSQNFKTLFLHQIPFESFQTFLNFLLSGPHKRTILDF